jgi:GNAT superfamily N-acetyltransferase
MGMAAKTAAQTTTNPSLDPQPGTMNDPHDRIHNIMSVVRSQHVTDVSLSLQTKLLPEQHQQQQQQSDMDIGDGLVIDGSRRTGRMRYEWRNRETFILETLDPVLDAPARHTILQAAADYWSQQEQHQAASASTTSRFTLQSANKREVHASDLNGPAIQSINQALSECIFPLLRDAFSSDIRGDTLSKAETSNDEDDDDSILLLYDALIIEYDATSLDEGSDLRERPSQPLHRDLGILSVNIALDDPAQFQGGGTVFEKLLLSHQPSISSSDDDDDDISTILPRAAGHAVAHPSRERHAGGALISGRRTILVMFVTATHPDRDRRIQDGRMPHPLEAAARCKILGMKLSQPDAQVKVPNSSAPPLQGKQDQIVCYRIAVRYDPSDGEAWLYLAMALRSDASSRDDDGTNTLNEVIECLKTARQLNPNDGRVHNTLGIALQQQLRTSIPAPEMEDRQLQLLQNEIMESFCTAAKLHSRAAAAGCQGAAAEARSALLNWGLYHANRDEFAQAVPILRRVCLEGHVADTSLDDDDSASQQRKELDMREQEARRIVRDAKSLLSFCEQQFAADANNAQTPTAGPSDDDDSSFIVRLASGERDHVYVEAITDIINAAYRIGEKGIIVDSVEHPIHRVTVDDVQIFMRDGKLLILTTTDDQEKVLGCVKVEASQVQDPDDPLLGQTICEWGCFAVDLAEQHQGHGRRLVQAAESYARNELSCTWLQLELLAPTHERHAHKDMLREWYTKRLGYQLKWVNDHDKSTVRYSKGVLLLGVVQLATDADFTTYRKQL